jgi:hypothetical protein
MRKGTLAFGCMIGGLILLLIAFMGPWYVMSGSGTLGMEYNVGFYLTRMEAKGSFNGQDISWSVEYSEAKENAETIGVNIQSFTVIDTARILTLFALATALVSLVGFVGFVYRLGTLRIMKYIAGIFGLLTGVLALIPVVYVMTTGFSENSSDFWFSEKVLGVTITGGPGYAWYLMIIVSIIVLICAVAILAKKVNAEDAVVSTDE